MSTSARLDPEIYAGDADQVARALLGATLVRIVDGVRLAGVIVETEAYVGQHDLAAHTRRGLRSARNASMWLGGGHAYVYFVYGMHHCFNVVTGPPGSGAAVLIRALRPVEGIEECARRRGFAVHAGRRSDSTRLASTPPVSSPAASSPPAAPAASEPPASHAVPSIPRDLCRGPARLAQAMGIDRALDGADLRVDGRIWIERGLPVESIVATPRIGVEFADAWADARLRYIDAAAEEWLSRRLVERTRDGR